MFVYIVVVVNIIGVLVANSLLWNVVCLLRYCYCDIYINHGFVLIFISIILFIKKIFFILNIYLFNNIIFCFE